MDFTKTPTNWDTLPAGWTGNRRSVLAEQRGLQQTVPSASLIPGLMNVGPDGALQLSAVWACLDLRSSLVASLPLFVYQAVDGNRQLARGSRLWGLLHDSPNARMTPFEFWRAMVLSLDLRGRSYARIQRAPDGEAVALWPMPADQVESAVLPDGSMAYAYRIGNDVALLAQENVLHLKGLGNGTEGLGKLECMRATVHEAAQAQGAATRIFGNGGKPTGVLMVDGVLKEPQRKALADRFAEMQMGSLSRLYVLEANMKYQQLSLSPEDQQLLQSRQWSVEEVCRWLGTPPVLIHHANVTAWGSGIEQLIDGFHKTQMAPLVCNIEQALTKRVLTSAQRARFTVEFSMDALLRANLKDRMEVYAKAVQNGIKTRNECRQLENDPALPGGDALTAQSNLVPLDLLGKVKPTGGSNADQKDPVAQ